jgi:hypothetical protein
MSELIGRPPPVVPDAAVQSNPARATISAKENQACGRSLAGDRYPMVDLGACLQPHFRLIAPRKRRVAPDSCSMP